MSRKRANIRALFPGFDCCSGTRKKKHFSAIPKYTPRSALHFKRGCLGVFFLGTPQNGGFPFGFPLKPTKKGVSGYPSKKDEPPLSMSQIRHLTSLPTRCPTRQSRFVGSNGNRRIRTHRNPICGSGVVSQPTRTRASNPYPNHQ